MRISVSSWATTQSDLERTLAAILAARMDAAASQSVPADSA
jgi:hypothetical protein